MRGVMVEARMEVGVLEDLFGIVRAVKKVGERGIRVFVGEVRQKLKVATCSYMQAARQLSYENKR